MENLGFTNEVQVDLTSPNDKAIHCDFSKYANDMLFSSFFCFVGECIWNMDYVGGGLI